MLRKHALLAATLTLLTSFSAAAATTVIVHPSNAAALDEKSVQRIFLGKEKKFSDGVESIPINQVADSAVRGDFDENVLGRSSAQVSAYWSKLVFTGKGVPPKEVSSDADVIELVSKNPSAIGYVDSASVTGDVKAVSLN
ncbi:phosphate ABC transporter substrate-binding protein [Alteromonas oceanisediminis]|uniref:phosphate ABC transporter substrate-binding protein n=1 Tax=Alteromonas oceanisediminis TaxID=2836180 RepID=UPI001BDA8D83|nr:phosphate ABC transporter substrate-binding protein [Alteromonas oceanisediminis]MBT0587351.1 phosphate ABC transporter substrate-binding protein [Alteromonas oceanisediminis]